MSLLLAILRTLAPESTANKFGGGMFVKAMYDRRRRTKAPPRFVEYAGEGNPATPEAEAAQTKGRNLLPAPNPTKIKTAIRLDHRPVINLTTFAEGGAARAKAEKIMKAELEIQARRNQNDALAVILLLAS